MKQVIADQDSKSGKLNVSEKPILPRMLLFSVPHERKELSMENKTCLPVVPSDDLSFELHYASQSSLTPGFTLKME